jgi:uncharacterized 2Fe-2S/4Fe-4S cluster protein (DUF4445 family)
MDASAIGLGVSKACGGHGTVNDVRLEIREVSSSLRSVRDHLPAKPVVAERSGSGRPGDDVAR